MKTLTVDAIMSFDPCYDREQIEQLFSDAGYADKPAPLSAILNAHIPAKDIFWLVLRSEIIGERELQGIAMFAAEIVLPIFEYKYPTDGRPRQAIEAKKLWLDGKISDNELLAAADAASAAANAASAAADAAFAAARDAAFAAAYAADAASYDAYAASAAANAASAAAYAASAAANAASAAARDAAFAAAYAAAYAAADDITFSILEHIKTLVSAKD